MSSKLQGASLRINDTQEIAKIKTSVNNTNDEVPTSKAVKDLIDSLVPVALDVEGDWANKQIRNRIPDPEGLSFKVTYKNGNTAYVGAQLVSPDAWPGVGLQTATFSYTENGVTIYGTRSIGIELLPVSLTITGNWANYQYAGLAPDPDGLTFTVTYDDDSTAVVSGLTVTPVTWGNTEGTQTATFSYSQEVSSGTVTVSATKTANVVRKPTLLTITGNLDNNYQFYNNPPNLTGLTFTVSYSNGTTETIPVSNITISPDTWGSIGRQTATFSYTENGATVTKTQTANVVRKPSSLSIESGSLNDNYQYTNTAPNASTLRFKVYYNNGTSSEEKTVSDGIAVSPDKWSSSTGQQPATFSYTENGVTVSAVRNANVVRKLTGLSISGSWSKTQYTNTAVDYTGLTFTASYNNNTTATVTTPSVSPSTWSSAEGTQTATFSYTENGITVSASSSVNVKVPWETVPLTLQAREAGNISITKTGDPGTIYYSKNGGSQTVLDSGVNISVVTGDKVSFYRTLSGNLSDDNYFTIKCTNNCYVYGNIMSLYNRNNFSNLTTIQYEYAFYNLFNRNLYIDINESVGKLVLPATTLAQDCYEYMFNRCTSLTTAPTLPATTLANACYYDMFNYCTNLTTPPSILPATTLAEECYGSMFSHCTSLTTAPTLPATTLADYCYSSMFNGCESLTTAPTLPATTLADYCYYAMFRGCSSLTTAPSILPATTLANACYESMFRNCSSLTTAPTLPATTLVSYCYEQMFNYCTSLTTITCLATNISAYGCTTAWVGDVASSGTFYKNSAMSSWTIGTNGIPSGWTVRNA